MARRRILIVDDHPASRESLAALLSESGFEGVPVASGAEALARVQAESFDLVLLDVSMPGRSGLEALRQMRVNAPLTELPVILVTGRTQSEEMVAGLDAGANDYVTKPIDLPVLLARLRTQLALLELARLKDEFLRMASHDLKNPLTTVLGGTETLIDLFPVGTVMTAEGVRMAHSIHRRAEDMLRIVKDFLDLQALDDGALAIRRDPIDLAAIAARVVDDQRAYAERKHITLALEASAPVPLTGDAERIDQIAQNLVGNAIKFSSAGTRVTVRANAVPGAARLEVIDEGPGIAPEDQAKLFVKRARLANRPTGGEHSSGLGLAICKRMMDLLGGRIGASNNVGRGATFWLELPRAD